MTSRLLKALTIAAGTGLAIGFTSIRRLQTVSNMSSRADDDRVIERLDRIEARLTSIESSGREKFDSLMEVALAPRVEELRLRLHSDMVETMETRLTAFEQNIDSKVSTRLSTLEKALIDQAAVITALSKRAVESEENFQRLIGAVERLCEERQNVTPRAELPFERQLSEAFQRQPGASQAESGFRPKIVPEDEFKQRHRRPMSRL